MSIERYSCYEFEIRDYDLTCYDDMDYKLIKGYFYVIFDTDYKPSDSTIIRESDEWYDTQQEARFAAIGHITLLENGEG